MVGQRKLIDKLNNLKVLPQSLLITGPFGCGKHLLVNMLAEKFGVDVIDISDNILEAEFLLQLQQTPIPSICIVDSLKIQERSQNAILKLLEDPSDHLFICILAESTEGVLPTIYNRCLHWEFEPYSKDELLLFCEGDSSELICDIANTPGKVEELCRFGGDINKYIKDAENIFTLIDRALPSNILILLDKVSFKRSEEMKLNIDTFSVILSKVAMRMLKESNLKFSSYKLVNDFASELLIFNIDKQKLYEKFLLDLKDDIRKYKNQN